MPKQGQGRLRPIGPHHELMASEVHNRGFLVHTRCHNHMASEVHNRGFLVHTRCHNHPKTPQFTQSGFPGVSSGRGWNNRGFLVSPEHFDTLCEPWEACVPMLSMIREEHTIRHVSVYMHVHARWVVRGLPQMPRVPKAHNSWSEVCPLIKGMHISHPLHP